MEAPVLELFTHHTRFSGSSPIKPNQDIFFAFAFRFWNTGAAVRIRRSLTLPVLKSFCAFDKWGKGAETEGAGFS
jgi:hypothetical protein